MSPSTNRGILYVSIAIMSHLLTNSKETMTQYELLLLAGGALLTGLITLRAFIDQTPTGKDPQKVEVTNTEENPVQTEETRSNDRFV
jgi:hypothetical protein